MILRQTRALGRWWGNLQTVAQHTNIYIQFLILAFSGTAAYAVVSTQMHEWGWTLPFWVFVLIVVLGLVLLGLFVWSMAMPSSFATWNHQWWEHDNPLRQEVKEMREQQNQIEEKVNKLLALYGKEAADGRK